MNRWQKEVQQSLLENEEEVIKALKSTYSQALKDIQKKSNDLQTKINDIQELIDDAEDGADKARLISMQQSKIYQKQYQDALKKQISSILDNMQVEEFKTISEYLDKCYEDGFIGVMYDLQNQGIPLCFPLDQEAVVKAELLDSKISEGLYTRLGQDIAELKRKISAEVSRGISSGLNYQQMAQQLLAIARIGFNNALRITRTEGHRVQLQSAMNACINAREMGADVVKQWDSTLDGRTRRSHRKVDGEIRELEEPFSNGLMFPGDPDGEAKEVIHCRCALLQRARWAIPEENFTKYDNFTGELKQFENKEAYDGFKAAYYSEENMRFMNYVEQLEEKYSTKDFQKILTGMTTSEYNHFTKLQAARPTFEGMYKGQNIVRIKAKNFNEFKTKYKEVSERK